MGITHVEEKKTATPFSILYRESSLRKKPNRAWVEGRGRGRNEQFAGAGFNLLRIHFLDRFLVPYRCCAGGEGERKGERRNREEKNERDTLVFGPFCSKEEKVMGGGEEGVKRAAARRNSSLALIALGGLLSIMSGNRWLTQFPAARFVWPA